MCFPLIDCLSFVVVGVWNWTKLEICLKLDAQGQGGGIILVVDGQKSGGIENWIIFMDVICVSSLTDKITFRL